MMDKHQVPKLKKLGVFTLDQGKSLGISQQDISRLVAAKDLVRLGRGIYLHPKASLDNDVGFQIAFSKFGPDSAIGGLSALYHYNLAEQVPGEIWVMVPPDKRTRETGYRLIRTKTILDKQIVDEKGYRIVTVERSVLEALKFITKIGERTAVKAAREALATRKTTESKLSKAAKELELESLLAKHLEVIVP
ncbi:MAG: type IV toxin-antitoxin system AbiEi family antitoxin domain-containing protein [Blastocatellia bacterium]|nr:type IV toxin-antitoxin system AbiEi family antitoxin domain-containing protein [Blastocatellia bacterium]